MDSPLEVAQYAADNQISDKPSFDWWVTEVLKRSKRLIGKAKCHQKMYHLMGYKYGIRVSRTLKEALQFNKENGNNLWEQAFEK